MSSEQKNTGRVKWFNAKRGYGFIIDTTTSDEIFVHHSSIITPENVFKTLSQGEYVEFVRSTDDNNKVIATAVSGINNGPLMCQRERKPQQDSETNGRPASSRGRGRSSTYSRGRGRGDSSRGVSSRGRRFTRESDYNGNRNQTRRPLLNTGGYKPSGAYAKAASSKNTGNSENTSSA